MPTTPTPSTMVLEIDGQVAKLSYPLDHYPFSKGIAR
jgi:hypothetical protein